MDNAQIDNMISDFQKGMDANNTDAPVMSIDPKTSQVSVVGDPNKIADTKGEYDLTFTYPEDMLTEEDKARMTLNEESGEYEATIHYGHKRVKPLYRTTVAMNVADVMMKAHLFMEDFSYNSDSVTRNTIRSVVANIKPIAEIAQVTLDIPDDQVQYIKPDSLAAFFIDMMHNEQNVLKESAGFLEPSIIKQMIESLEREMANQPKTTAATGTQQN